MSPASGPCGGWGLAAQPTKYQSELYCFTSSQLLVGSTPLLLVQAGAATGEVAKGPRKVIDLLPKQFADNVQMPCNNLDAGTVFQAPHTWGCRVWVQGFRIQNLVGFKKCGGLKGSGVFDALKKSSSSSRKQSSSLDAMFV